MSTTKAPPVAIAPVLHVTMGSDDLTDGQDDHPRLSKVDVYRVLHTDLSSVRGLILGAHVDQIFLERHQDVLTGFVRTGGRIAVMGHPLTNFLAKLGVWRRISYTGPKDLAITLGEAHPVWEGVDPVDLSVRRGVTGFYARGYADQIPTDAIVTTRIGRHALPLDYVYPLGDGQVLVHGGNDLTGWKDEPNTSARMTPQLVDWLVAR